MLALTTEAAVAIRGIVEASELPEESGLRISVARDEGDEAEVSLDFVEEPEAGDAVVGELGAHVFLDEDALPLLDGKVLDATIADDGVTFDIRDAEPRLQPPSRNGSGPEDALVP